MEKSRIEISTELLEAVRQLAASQGRPVEEVLNEAVARYLAGPVVRRVDEGVDLPGWVAGAGDPEGAYRGWTGGGFFASGTVHAAERPRDGFLALIDRMASRFDLDDPDEALRIAVEEQHAFRRERAGAPSRGAER